MTGITFFEPCLCYIIVEKSYHSIDVPFLLNKWVYELYRGEDNE